MVNILYITGNFDIICTSFSKEIFEKGGTYMTSYDLIWLLIELILKDKETKSKLNEQQDN